jgi:D-alanine transaminase
MEENMSELTYLNGKIMPTSEAMVPVEDRGYQFGDAVYEYVASYNGRFFCMEEHLARLQRSMQELDFPKVSNEKVRNALMSLFKQAQLPRAGIYIQISRGVAPRDHGYTNLTEVQMVMSVHDLPETHPLAEKGAFVITMEDFRWGRCDIKTVQLLPNAMGKQKALDAGVHDTIFVAEDQTVREATSSNVFIVKNGTAVTHPLTRRILPGITRMVILSACKELKIPVEERLFKTDELYGADEVFLTGTTTEVLPIVKIDDRTISQGTPGPITRQFYKELRSRALEPEKE